VDLFVLHYDVCGVSRECFRILQDRRELSVHFLLDIDGTIYQTLDLAEQAWHARQANPRSIGIEIANIGAYPLDRTKALERWYGHDGEGLRVTIPDRLGGGGVRTPDFIGRPARSEPIIGQAQDQSLVQMDFTPEQYESLAALAATLCRTFPNMAPDAPRDPEGNVRTGALPEDEFDAFGGILGHQNISTNKTDPGPAFDWERFLVDVRGRLGPE